MSNQAYRFRFYDRDVFERAVRVTHQQALLAAVGLFGQTRVRMDGAHAVDGVIKVLVIDAGTPVGMAVCQIFTAFLGAAFGHDAFDVRRVEMTVAPLGARL